MVDFLKNVFKKEKKEHKSFDENKEMLVRLQLAESYLELGETEEAKNVLEIVLQLGKKKEKEMARALLSRITQLQGEYV